MRRKTTSNQDSQKQDKDSEIVYCDNRLCGDMSCARYIKNAKFDVMIKVKRFQLDKDGKCKNRI